MDDFNALASSLAVGLGDVRGCLILSRDGLVLGSSPADTEASVTPAWVRFAALGDIERGFAQFGPETWCYVRRGPYGAFTIVGPAARPGLVLDQMDQALRAAEEARARRDAPAGRTAEVSVPTSRPRTLLHPEPHAGKEPVVIDVPGNGSMFADPPKDPPLEPKDELGFDPFPATFGTAPPSAPEEEPTEPDTEVELDTEAELDSPPEPDTEAEPDEPTAVDAPAEPDAQPPTDGPSVPDAEFPHPREPDALAALDGLADRDGRTELDEPAGFDAGIVPDTPAELVSGEWAVEQPWVSGNGHPTEPVEAGEDTDPVGDDAVAAGGPAEDVSTGNGGNDAWDPANDAWDWGDDVPDPSPEAEEDDVDRFSLAQEFGQLLQRGEDPADG